MSFGFSIGDFIAVGKLAYDLIEACKNASAEYHELGELCRIVSIAVEACRPNDPFTVLRRQNAESIAILAADCLSTLRQLQDLLGSYQNMNSVRNIGRKIGFLSAKQERNDIRARLQEHLSAISTFLNGVQMETLGLTVRLVLKMLEGQETTVGHANLQDMINDPEKLEMLLKDFGAESQIARDELKKNQDVVKTRLKEALDQDTEEARSSIGSTGLDSNLPETQEKPLSLPGPAEPSIAPYNPKDIVWFADRAHFFKWITTDASCFITVRLPPPTIRYSTVDEYHSTLPEGWSLTPTLVRNNQKTAEAYYYVFNNLSCAADNVPKTSRAYCLQNPFLSDADDAKEYLVRLYTAEKFDRKPKSRFTWRVPPGESVLGVLPDSKHFTNRRLEFAGFCLNDALYLDFSDDLSRVLARIETGHGGKRENYSDETISRSLPETWTWDPDVNGPGRHVYMNDETDEETTVHPARFFDPTSNDPTYLPPGWDRRLDALGNLFFVDHNTKSAVREDPRFNPNIDVSTGLPKGWKAIKDHNGEMYFYRCHGKKIYGTSVPQTMNDKSVRGKHILKAEPQVGQDPSALDLRSLPRERELVRKHDESGQDNEKNRIRSATDEEKRHYYKLFANAPKENELFLTFAEALNHCMTFKVLPGIAAQILLYSDTNQDRRFDCDKYATALHRIRVSMEKEYSSTQIPPPTLEEKETYYGMFKQAKKPDELVLTLDEVLQLCKDYNLPDTLVDSVWRRADTNQDSHYNPNEFANGMHQIMKEYERREAIRMDTSMTGAEPTPPPPVIATTATPSSKMADVGSRLAKVSLAGTRQSLDDAMGTEGEVADSNNHSESPASPSSQNATAATTSRAGDASPV